MDYRDQGWGAKGRSKNIDSMVENNFLPLKNMRKT